MNQYAKPSLVKLGDFRALTRIGVGQNYDGMTVVGDPNGKCDYTGDPTQVCRS